MVGYQLVFYAVMGQKTAGFAGIFGRNEINLPQNVEGPEGNVIPVSDRCGDYV
jgi:hypothetical protein